MRNKILMLMIITISICCSKNLIEPTGYTIETRILLPQGYERVTIKKSSFGAYLRNLPLKKHGSKVLLHTGSAKVNQRASVAVVNLPIGKRDLHQCADAVMRFRAEYLWKQKRYKDIHFNFTNGFRVDYTKWMNGNRIAIKGNKTWWVKKRSFSNSYKDFWRYMETIFAYAGTYSLAKELKKVSVDNIAIGDVFIQGGMPGHAVIVVDMAVHKKSKNKIFLLAQSYMPAQETHVLSNHLSLIGPWYSLDQGEMLVTPEWTFSSNDLKRFP